MKKSYCGDKKIKCPAIASFIVYKAALFGFPATGCSTRKNQSVGRNRKSDLIRCYNTVVFFHNSSEHVCQYSRLKSCRVGVDQEKQRIVRENLCTQFYQWVNRFFNFPDFTFWSSAVRWWIHDDGIIVIAAADLTFYEFYTVINQPADRSVR